MAIEQPINDNRHARIHKLEHRYPGDAELALQGRRYKVVYNSSSRAGHIFVWSGGTP